MLGLGTGVTLLLETKPSTTMLVLTSIFSSREIRFNFFFFKFFFSFFFSTCLIFYFKGDSGGPAICDGRVHGIVMGGLYCAKADYPGVYTRVAHYVHWIRDIIRA